MVPVPASFPTDYAFQLGIAIGGVLWLIGTYIAYRYMLDRPGPPFPKGENLTLVSVSVIWAQNQLGFTTTQVLILAAEVPFLALIGSYSWNQLQTYFKINSKRMVVIINCIYILIPLWGCLSFIPSSPIGYKSKIELFVAAGIHGLLLGAAQSSCRSLFAQLLPAGEESQFFSLYEITDKGSAWVGPLVIASIDDSGSNKAFAFVFLLAQFVVSLILYLCINLEKGIEEGKEFAAKERQLEYAMDVFESNSSA
ncbi:Autophagy protein 22 [Physocladia obscura]|uniref:Autophagy-related protein n=1 Tax=Physocladia obscura TaxID=109957 RepID=A0AAD5STI6_9FUNG|nr:Autophagy protein 22 [Physocladia obscura]